VSRDLRGRDPLLPGDEVYLLPSAVPDLELRDPQQAGVVGTRGVVVGAHQRRYGLVYEVRWPGVVLALFREELALVFTAGADAPPAAPPDAALDVTSAVDPAAGTAVEEAVLLDRIAAATHPVDLDDPALRAQVITHPRAGALSRAYGLRRAELRRVLAVEQGRPR